MPAASSGASAPLPSLAGRAATVKSADLDGFAARSLPSLERVFLEFYRSYDQYRTDLTAWQAKYTASQPIAVAVPGAPQVLGRGVGL